MRDDRSERINELKASFWQKLKAEVRKVFSTRSAVVTVWVGHTGITALSKEKK